MKNNKVLYILLLFLIIVNGFFLFNYMAKSNNDPGRKDPMSFLKKELNFNEAQLEKLKVINATHHQNMMRTSDEIKNLKDALLTNISNESVNKNTIDSIASLIGDKETKLEKEVFYHFNNIHNLCNAKQKQKFNKIIKDAMHKGVESGGRPRGAESPEGNRPPPPPPNGF
ncbi:Spy/CpxP family protein refolding chaperone [Lacinutrix gracilariae]|uniref:Spy/CpxP family protein refolding chaperone n=1 Tax=Lacinutrix gracilariae TaxID=1747198 RepID=A0ABW5K114_9FLAO